MQWAVRVTLGGRRKNFNLNNGQKRDISAHRRIEKVSQKGLFLVLWKIKTREGSLRLTGFCCCNLTIKIMLVLMVLVLIQTNLKV